MLKSSGNYSISSWHCFFISINFHTSRKELSKCTQTVIFNPAFSRPAPITVADQELPTAVACLLLFHVTGFLSKMTKIFTWSLRNVPLYTSTTTMKVSLMKAKPAEL